MERIRHALEQAEQDRLKRKSADADAVVEPIGAASEPVAQLDSAMQASEVRYVRTRVEPVDSKVLEEHRLVSALPDHELTDAYRVLRTRVLQGMNANKWNSLAITSPASGSGKTVTAINLAISLAREVNRTVLLADFDLRNPSIHEYFGVRPEFGLSDYLHNDVPIEKILFSPSIPRLVVLPGRESIHNSSEMLRSPKMSALVEELKSRYDDRLILFDLPPILAIDDAIAFKPYTDAMLMVADNGVTKRQDLRNALTILKGTPVLGTVLNRSRSVASRGTYRRA